MNTITPRRNEIYLAHFPLADSEKELKRPIVILSQNHYNGEQPDVMACGITTNLTHELCIPITTKDLEYGKLMEESNVRVDMITRVYKGKLILKIGKITDVFHKKILDEIVELIK